MDRLSARSIRRSASAIVLAATAGASAFALLPAAAHAAAAARPGTHHAKASPGYVFQTLDDPADPAFNQLLGINVRGVISGYFGSGATGHPNKGYLLNPPYTSSSYVNENFPGSVQTQVTGLNNKGDTCGFWVDGHGNNRDFVEWNGVFASYHDPSTPNTPGSVNQLLGINDAGTAVGFYNDAAGHSHAITLNQATGKFTPLKVPGTSKVATGITDQGAIVGFGTNAAGVTSSWLLANGHLTGFQFP
ncbi:MAG TPA: hypothetical protein VGS19_21315, partial [Streptosporangiaceae bacterium]|nr:hypothetical protein [Streptosporangiaceae bacterium]